MTTVHAYTQEQNLQDGPHRDPRRARAAGVNIVPTTTGAAKAIGLVLPKLDGKLDGRLDPRARARWARSSSSTRRSSREVTRDEVLAAYRAAAEGRLAGILDYADDPLVSSDITGEPASSIFDSALTRVERPPRQGRGLVRQRVGLLEPRRRHARAPRPPLTGRRGGTPPPATAPALLLSAPVGQSGRPERSRHRSGSARPPEGAGSATAGQGRSSSVAPRWPTATPESPRRHSDLAEYQTDPSPG